MLARAGMVLAFGAAAAAILMLGRRQDAGDVPLDLGGFDFGYQPDYPTYPTYSADAPAWDWQPSPDPVAPDVGYSGPEVPYRGQPAPAWSQETSSSLGAFYDRRLPPEPMPAAEGEGTGDWFEDPMGYTGFETGGEGMDIGGGGEVEISNKALIKSKLPASLRDNVDAFDPYVVSAAGRYGVRPEIVRGVIYTESRYKPDAKALTSSATGLMQMTKAAAAEVGYPDINAMFDPASAIDAGTAYLGKMIAKFGEKDGIRAYYAGAGTISRELATEEPTRLTVEADRYFSKVSENV